LVTSAQFFLNGGQQFCAFVLESKPLTPIKEQLDLIKNKSIDLLKDVIQPLGKGTGTNINSLTNPLPPSTDPCAPIDPYSTMGINIDASIGETYYVAGLIAIVVVCTITTLLIALDHNNVE